MSESVSISSPKRLRTLPVLVEGPARRRCKAVLQQGMGPTPEVRSADGLAALQAATEAGAPAWVRLWWEVAAAGGDPSDILIGCTAMAAWLRGWTRGRWAAGWGIGEPLGPFRCSQRDREAPCPLWDCWVDDQAGFVFVDATGKWLLPAAPAAEFVGPRNEPAWWDDVTAARGACMRSVAVIDRGPGRAPLAALTPCRRRACPVCTRSAMRRVVWRYWPLFAAPLRAGFCLEMFTIGSLGVTTNRHEYGAWRRCVARLCREMARGVVECGIPEGAWRGGLVVVELVPRDRGAYVHAHIVAVRRAFYPYGWSSARWSGRGAERPKGKRWHPAAVAGLLTAAEVAEWAPRSPSDHLPNPLRAASACLGAREVARRCGLGEVSDMCILEQGGNVAGYLAKVTKYLGKVQADDAPVSLEQRPDLQCWVRGTRRAQPFGALSGLLAGPDAVRADEGRSLIGLFPLPDGDEQDGPGLETSPVRGGGTVHWGGVTWEDDAPRTRLAWMDRRCIETWREWCDVDGLYRTLGVDERADLGHVSTRASGVYAVVDGLRARSVQYRARPVA